MKNTYLPIASVDTLNKKLQDAYINEENYWKQRSRVLWLQLGDRNTGYFHAATKGRRARNTLSTLEDEAGNAVFRDDQIAKIVVKHFQAIFTSSGNGNLNVVQRALDRKVTEEMNSELIKIPTDEEIRNAVFSINPDKAPGPDGFSASFFQSNWASLEKDISKEIKNFFVSSRLPGEINITHVCLIPKVQGPRRVGDYRPIALCNVYYKIISKILTGRLQAILPLIISENQSAFVPDRAISDNVLITHEVLHYLKTSKAKKRCSMAIKTDMSKAYDRVEWNFLQEVLHHLGFHHQWIGWIMQCVTTVTYSFLINGGARGKVRPQRGIRQGDPLSPFLFILCSEVLSGLCHKAQREKKLLGINVALGSPRVNHLLFADDTMFFCRTNAKSIKAVKDIIKDYGEASGQVINFNKSSITFSRKAPRRLKQGIMNSLNIHQEGGVGKYLGLPEHFGRSKKDLFASIVSRISQKAENWSNRFLSSARKLVLLRSVLSSLPVYAMSCFALPLSLCSKIQSALTSFWWDSKPNARKIAWVSWEKITNPKSMGGLGIRDIQDFNVALLAKLSWRLLTNPQNLLFRILKGKYFPSSSFMNAPESEGISHGWRSILWGRTLLKPNVGWALGDGNSVNVWSDKWLSTSKALTPIGPAPKGTKDIKVSELFLPNSRKWNLPKINELLPVWKNAILMLHPSEKGGKDKQIWLGHPSGSYTSKSGYALARVEKEASLREVSHWNWTKEIWNIKVPEKIKSFLWRVAHNALPCGTSLQVRGLWTHSHCERCDELESLDHLFFSCRFIKEVWETAPITLFLSTDNFRGKWKVVLQALALPPSGASHSPLGPWLLWHVWLARNKFLFSKKSSPPAEIISLAITRAKEWDSALLAKSIPPKPSIRRSPPVQTMWTCFTDASWHESTLKAGLAAVWKQSSKTIKTNVWTKSSVPSVLCAEAMAIREALQEASSQNLRSVGIFSDCAQLISILNSNDELSELHGIIYDIRSFSSHFDVIKFSFAPRLENREADSLAKLAYKQSVSLV